MLPTIQRWVDVVASRQYLGGWAGRGDLAQVTYGGGGGHLNAGGTAVVTFLMLAKECGVGGRTDKELWIWSGDVLMDLTRYQALKMKTKTIGGSGYLFVEAGGFSTRNKVGWNSPWYVMKGNWSAGAKLPARAY